MQRKLKWNKIQRKINKKREGCLRPNPLTQYGDEHMAEHTSVVDASTAMYTWGRIWIWVRFTAVEYWWRMRMNTGECRRVQKSTGGIHVRTQKTIVEYRRILVAYAYENGKQQQSTEEHCCCMRMSMVDRRHQSTEEYWWRMHMRMVNNSRVRKSIVVVCVWVWLIDDTRVWKCTSGVCVWDRKRQ
jgi:hypothetical protein